MHRAPRWAYLAAALVVTGLTGCHSFGWGDDDAPAKGSPESIYSEARKNLRSGNYQGAIQKYESLEARFPFSEQSKQGQLDLLYAYYKNHSLESAIDQADQFIRENPAHPRVDYAWYIKGLVYFESGANWLERVFNADITKRPPQEAQKSLQSFQTLLQQFPKSPYGPDARQRIIYLRNRLADYELSVARYYMKRGAYVGAAARARGIIEQFDGAPAVDEALQIMAEAYTKLGITDLAASAEKVRAANPDTVDPNAQAAYVASMGGSAAGVSGQEGGPYSGPAHRAARWEALAGVSMQGGSTVDFEGGTTAKIDSGAAFVLGGGYNFTNRLRVGAQFGYDKKDYTANVVGQTASDNFELKGSLDTMSLMADATYNILAGPLTPYVTGGLGWSWVDTNIATEPPTVGCWWVPWYGYVCEGYQKTKSLNGLAYQLGVGLRWDFNRYWTASGAYNMRWVDLGNAKGTPSFDGFQLLVGWKF